MSQVNGREIQRKILVILLFLARIFQFDSCVDVTDIVVGDGVLMFNFELPVDSAYSSDFTSYTGLFSVV